MVKSRYLYPWVTSDLKEKMVFIGGPRQVGKTTLAQYIGQKNYPKSAYLNWDYRPDRKDILAGKFRADAELVIFDEIHKYKRWKNYLKGEFDKHRGSFQILVTGSARLDLYRRGGDSLMGRYHYYRLHPFSLAESLGREPGEKILQKVDFPPPTQKSAELFDQLFAFGGFPEPFLKKDERTLRRFHNERIDRLIREDIRDLESVRDISALQVLVELLPNKVGSKLSLNSLREDLNVAHKTIALWMDILERFYYHFRIYPYMNQKISSLRKEPKMYLWDWSEVQDDSARFENLVGSHLLKMVHFLHDTYGHKSELFYLRDTEGREVDFLVTLNRVPWMAVEAKLSQQPISSHLFYFSKKLNVPHAYQVVKDKGIDYFQDHVRMISADQFLSGWV